jgi:hypothetical protein
MVKLSEAWKRRLEAAAKKQGGFYETEVDITQDVMDAAHDLLEAVLAGEAEPAGDIDIGAARRFAYEQFADPRHPPHSQTVFKLLADFLRGEEVPEVSVHAEPLFKPEKRSKAA